LHAFLNFWKWNYKVAILFFQSFKMYLYKCLFRMHKHKSVHEDIIEEMLESSFHSGEIEI